MPKKPRLSSHEQWQAQRDRWDALPDWARALFASRNVRRLMEVYERVNRGADDILIMLNLARELETGKPSSHALRSIHGELESALERYKVPEIRGTIGDAMQFCEDWRDHRWLRPTSPCEKKERKADERLIEKVINRDIEVLGRSAAAGMSPAEALSGMGPLWPLGEPHWKSARWPTLSEMEASRARMWGEDAPELVLRPAPLELSERLPEVFHDLLGGPPFDLIYRSDYEVTDEGGRSGGRSMPVYRPRAHKIKFPTPGVHGFREPANDELLAAFRRASANVPSLTLLYAFLREHDGALLFWPLKGSDQDAHIQWFGLADQDSAVGMMAYYMDGVGRRPERTHEFLRRMGCDLSSLHCLALIDASFFLVPLRGSAAGQVFRYSARADRLSEFAATVEEAVGLFVRKVPQLSGQFAPQVEIGDEEKRGAVTQMKLVAVKARPPTGS